MSTYRPTALVSALFIFALSLTAQDDVQSWGNWRGPDVNGVATGGNPPTEWSEENNIRWKVPIPGLGSSSPVVWGDRIFVTSAASEEDDDLELAVAEAALSIAVTTGQRCTCAGRLFVHERIIEAAIRQADQNHFLRAEMILEPLVLSADFRIIGQPGFDVVVAGKRFGVIGNEWQQRHDGNQELFAAPFVKTRNHADSPSETAAMVLPDAISEPQAESPAQS